jgi:uncharacterized protein YycO
MFTLKIKKVLNFLFFLFLFLSIACKPDIEPIKIDVEIKEGDLVFRRGIGMASRFVLTTDKAGLYSHIGIVVNYNNEHMIVHAVPGENKTNEPDYIKMESFHDFFSRDNSKSGAILRLKSHEEENSIAAEKALEKYFAQIEFDHQYNLNDSLKMYCTELIWFVFDYAGIEISNGKRTFLNLPLLKGEFIFPSDIYSNENLEKLFSFSYSK